MKQRINYTNSKEDIFYKVIYPIFAKEFLFGNRYENFAGKVREYFILNEEQWEYISDHWNEKERFLTL